MTLDTLLLQPPAPALIALGLLGGCWALGRVAAARLLSIEKPDGLDRAAGFVCVTALLAAVVHFLALLTASSPSVLRIIGSAVLLANLLSLAEARRWSSCWIWPGKGSIAAFHSLSLARKYVALLALLSGLSLLGAALAPATDIDSLGYHLAIPLQWLIDGGAEPTPYWLQARLVGIGESVNMLGLAMGTDAIGPVFQFGGLLAVLLAVSSTARTPADRWFALLLVLACPLWVHLTLTSKPQLLPAAATTVALGLVLRHVFTAATAWRPGQLVLVFVCLYFAAACKYSFLPAALGITLLMLVFSYLESRWKAMPQLLGVATVTFCVVVLPIWFRNYWFYGDPVTPVLEGLRQDPDPAVVTFSWFLRNFGGEHSLWSLLTLPVRLVIPTAPGQLPLVLGAGALAVFVGLGRDRRTLLVLLMIASVTLFYAFAGQLQARFFIEPYLWCAMLATGASWGLRKKLLTGLLAVQLPLAAAITGFAAVSLFPGSLTAAAREQVRVKYAADYAAAQWLDQVLPADAIVATDRRSRFYASRPALAHDFSYMLALSALPDDEKQARILDRLRAGGANTLVATLPAAYGPYRWLAAKAGQPTHVSREFTDAVRNPWRRGRPYRLMVFDLRQVPELKPGPELPGNN